MRSVLATLLMLPLGWAGAALGSTVGVGALGSTAGLGTVCCGAVLGLTEGPKIWSLFGSLPSMMMMNSSPLAGAF